MGMSFSKIVANRRLANDVEMFHPGMLPLMRVTMKIGPSMFSTLK